jgi:hypothetical protein
MASLGHPGAYGASSSWNAYRTRAPLPLRGRVTGKLGRERDDPANVNEVPGPAFEIFFQAIPIHERPLRICMLERKRTNLPV